MGPRVCEGYGGCPHGSEDAVSILTEARLHQGAPENGENIYSWPSGYLRSH